MTVQDLNYFEKFFPIIKYGSYFGRDIIKMFRFHPEDLDNNVVEIHDIQEHETLQSVSLDYYGTQDLWFVIAIVNGIKDPFFDFPQSSQSLYKHTLKTNDGIFNNTEYEELIDQNKNKTRIRIVKKDYVNKFIADLSRVMGG